MAKHYLDFEKPLVELEREIENLRRFSMGKHIHSERTIKESGRQASSVTKRDILQLNRLANYTAGKAYRPAQDIPLYPIDV